MNSYVPNPLPHPPRPTTVGNLGCLYVALGILDVFSVAPPWGGVRSPFGALQMGGKEPCRAGWARVVLPHSCWPSSVELGLPWGGCLLPLCL